MFAVVVATDDPDFGLLDGFLIESGGVEEGESEALLVPFGGDVANAEGDAWCFTGDAESLASQGLATGVDAEAVVSLGQLAETVEVADEAHGNASDAGHFSSHFDAVWQIRVVDGNRLNRDGWLGIRTAFDGDVGMEYVAALAHHSKVGDLLAGQESEGDFGIPAVGTVETIGVHEGLVADSDSQDIGQGRAALGNAEAGFGFGLVIEAIAHEVAARREVVRGRSRGTWGLRWVQ